MDRIHPEGMAALFAMTINSPGTELYDHPIQKNGTFTMPWEKA
jgi:hypothetical protein